LGNRLGLATVLISFTCAPTMAGVLFQGTFSNDAQVELFLFTLSSGGVVTLQSFGYAGGVVNSNTVSPGGFAPDATLFTALGPDFVEATFDNGGHCGITQTDPVTGNCDDPYLQLTLPAGTYYLGLSVWDNQPQTGTLADGYKQAGNAGFTCAEDSLSGQFCDVTDALFRTRTANWAFAFTGVDTVADVSLPEPCAVWPMLSFCAIGVFLRWKSR